MNDDQRVLRLTAEQHETLKTHLFCGDGFEWIALALCGTAFGNSRRVYCVNEMQLIPPAACSVRSPTTVRWPVESGIDLFAKAERRGMAVLKIHSHPTGFDAFSTFDDESDRTLLAALANWSDLPIPHVSAFMLPNGAIRARTVDRHGTMQMLDRISICGDEVRIYDPAANVTQFDEADLRTRQAFGDRTTELLKSLRIGVAGCSGTGSWIVELLARLRVGCLVLVDPDRIERKNLNRIVNSTAKHASNRKFKVDALADAIAAMEFGTLVETIPEDLTSHKAIRALAGCDVVFGCLDSADGRDLLNRISTYYTAPYIDVGVRIDADGRGGVNQICAAVHFIIPGGSSLLSRGVITAAQVSAQSLRRHDPQQYQALLKESYIQGVQVDSPAVVSLNGFAASHAVNELLARIHQFRNDENAEYRYQLFSLRDGTWLKLPDGPACELLRKKVGRGECTPMLDNPLSR